MVSESEEEVKKALEEVLKLYGIEMDELEAGEEEEEKRGDYSEIISKTQLKLDDLNEKAEQVFERTGMTREQLEAYSMNPNNFTKEQWDALEKVKGACEKYRQDALKRVGDVEFEKKAEKQKRKKQPGRFAKKKHWIPL